MKNTRVVTTSTGKRNVQYVMRPAIPDHSKRARWYGYSYAISSTLGAAERARTRGPTFAS